MREWNLTLPLTEAAVRELRAGDRVKLTGVLYTGRDEAHMYLCRMLDAGEGLPFDLRDACIYYVGPCPAAPGQAIGSCGPTTSGRMDKWAPRLMNQGLRAMIGKGSRSEAVKEAIKQHTAVYLAATGGAGALLARRVKRAEVVAFPELGAEAVYRLEVEDFPCTVINDCVGGDLYQLTIDN